MRFARSRKVKIVLNADDFGYSTETVEATIRCFEAGALTSATIMPRMPATEAAVTFARAHPEFSFGAHLTFVGDGEECGVSPPEKIPALARPDGSLRTSNRVRVRALLGRIPVAQIEQELAAQLSRLTELGVPVSHVDSHCHLHKLPPFQEALRRGLPRFGLRRVRNVQDVYVRQASKRSPTYWLGAGWRRRLMRSFVTTDHFYMATGSGDTGWERALLKRFAGSAGAEQTLEIGVHPGHRQAWRQQEFDAVMAFAPQARAAGHTLVTWREIGV